MIYRKSCIFFSDFFSMNIDIADDEIIPIKIEKVYKESDKDTEPPLRYDNDSHIKMHAIKRNNYCEYIMYEVKN